MRRHVPVLHVLAAGWLSGVAACSTARKEAVSEEDVAPAPEAPAAEDSAALLGTSWRLVKFEGGDGTVLTPDDPSEYTLTFEPGGRLTARIACNRGMGTWTSAGPPQLEFGPLALTRAACPPGSLHDLMVKQLPYVRSYVMEGGHLHLSLMADGGIYEFEPAGGEGSRSVRLRVPPP